MIKMIQCRTCFELYDDNRYQNTIPFGICRLCFHFQTIKIPLIKEEKKFENIIFNNRQVIENQALFEFLNLEHVFYNDFKDQYFKYLLFIINLIFIVFQILNFIYLEFNNFIICLHLFILIYSELILYKIRLKNRFEEYYMQIIYNYKKYNNL